jgi:hypothetical protein
MKTEQEEKLINAFIQEKMKEKDENVTFSDRVKKTQNHLAQLGI